MKKKFLVLALAAVMSLSMGFTSLAAPSPAADTVTESSDSNDDNDTTPVVSTVVSESLSTGVQKLSEAAVAEFATTTTVQTSVAGATIAPVAPAVATAAVSQAKAVAGNNAFIASIVDLNVPAGTGEATFTLGCPNVWAGQKVLILHQKSDGTWETITPSSVANNAVTFTLSSYSPVAIVIDTTAPKTGDMVLVVAGLAFMCLAGAVVFGRKKAL